MIRKWKTQNKKPGEVEKKKWKDKTLNHPPKKRDDPLINSC